MYDFTLDRVCVFDSVEYRILETLKSGTLLVKEEDYKEGKYPSQTYIIPGE
ncbi:hypothetical protein ACJEBK_28500 [Peribacillus frigoritolerans]|uniref:hypothetical protein n=1 Tax=Peribacillus frigoritolerans TaxID=450367 RepID=UPI0038712B34